MKELGLFGMTIPEEFGGLGFNTDEECMLSGSWVIRHRPSDRSSVPTTASGPRDWSWTARSAKVPLPAEDGERGNHRFLRSHRTRCRLRFRLAVDDGTRHDGDYILNGVKRYITNAPHAQLFTVFARTDPTTGARGVSAFLVDATSQGISLGQANRKMGQQGAHVCDVIFDECRVPESALLGGPAHLNKGFLTAMKTLDRGRLHISALAVGCAERLINDSLNYAIERKQFGEPIAHFQLIQAMLADSRTEAYAARCMVLDAAKRRDAGEPVTMLASCCKLFASEMVGRVADRAVQIYGGAGYMEEYGIERFYRDVRLFRIYEGTSQIQQTLIARNMIRSALE